MSAAVRPEPGVATEVEAREGLRPSLWRRFLSHPLAPPGLVIVGLMVAAAVFAPALMTHPYWEMYPITGLSATDAPLPPQWSLHGFFLGTDQLGRDEFSRLIWAARVSLQVGVLGSAISAAIGITLGVAAGYFGGWVDSLIMRVTDVMFAFPALFFLILVASVLSPSVPVIYLTIGLLGWPTNARFTRGQVLSLREQPFVEVARSLGARPSRIIWRHLVPNAIAPIVVVAGMSIPVNIIYESTLSFLGIGVPTPIPSWGKMIAEGLSYLNIAPWLVIFPTIAICLATVGFNLLLEALNATLNTRGAVVRRG
ncbi:MAG: ABC transporter permease [Firmicutes bacterium]|nr:ABC transporter permease [Bacillota bacterium]